jgi:hypothetical protein
VTVQAAFNKIGFSEVDLQNVVAVGDFQVTQLKIPSIDALRQCGFPEAAKVLVGARLRNGLQPQASTILTVGKQNR